MLDREKVIDGLEDLKMIASQMLPECYVRTARKQIDNALSLLKEQRTTVEIVAVAKENGGVNLFAFNESKDAIRCFCYWKDKGATVTSAEVDIQ